MAPLAPLVLSWPSRRKRRMPIPAMAASLKSSTPPPGSRDRHGLPGRRCFFRTTIAAESRKARNAARSRAYTARPARIARQRGEQIEDGTLLSARHRKQGVDGNDDWIVRHVDPFANFSSFLGGDIPGGEL